MDFDRSKESDNKAFNVTLLIQENQLENLAE